MKIKQIFPNILLLFLSVALGLFVIEIASRHLDRPHFEENKAFVLTDYSVFIYDSNYEYKIVRQEFASRLKINSKGLRDKEIDYIKPNGIKRIILLGDSFVLAKELPLEKTISKKLEQILGANSKNVKYETINMGFGGFGPTAEVVLLEKEGSKYNPDIVIFNFYTGNDVTKIDFGAAGSISKEIFQNHDSLENVNMPVTKIQKLKQFIFRNFFTYSYFTAWVNNIRNKEDASPYYGDSLNKEYDKNMEAKLEKAKIILKHLKRYADYKGVKLLVVLVPIKEQVDEKKHMEIVDKYKLNLSQIDINKPQKIFMEFGKENNITMLDMLPEFSKRNKNNSFYFEIDGHWNEKGHELAANLIYNKLKSEGFIENK